MPADRFPLWLHPGGHWAKKFHGRVYYFGRDKDAALARYVAEWPDIVAGRGRHGREESSPANEVTVAYLCNSYLHRQRQRVQAGEMGEAAYQHSYRMCLRVLAALGRTRRVVDLRPPDYQTVRNHAQRTLGSRTLVHFIGLARALFRYGASLTDAQPKYGDAFQMPPARQLRLKKEERGERLLSAAEIRKLLDAAGPPMRAMIVLGVNCGFGATDCSELRHTHLDARPGWLSMPRRKTGIARRCPLWPETVAALEDARQHRPPPENRADADRVFLSPRGLPCVRWLDGAKTGKDTVRDLFRRLAKRAGVQVPKGSSFYVLRHVFRTVADELPDRPAVDLVMGHTDTSMRAAYVERVDDKRLAVVTNHVRAWLWPRRGTKH